MNTFKTRQRQFKLLWIACGLAPLLWLLWAAVQEQLGPNPAETLIRTNGQWALRWLIVVLWIRPLAMSHEALRPLLGTRRMVGLWCFFYASLHLTAYGLFDHNLEVAAIAKDVLKRPFILVGMLSFVLLLALAATSPRAMVRRLGGRRWQRLHRWVYAIAVLALLHFFWMRSGKRVYTEVWIDASLITLALLWRLKPLKDRLWGAFSAKAWPKKN